MGDGDGARGVHRRAAPPENVMSKIWYLVRVVMVAGVIVGTLSAPAGAQTTAARGKGKEGEVQSDPIKCWWKADRTAVRVGERFGLVLTCAVIEAGPITVVPVLNQLEPGALSITPFEVVSGARGEDMVASPWRYVQFDYSVRLLSDGFFGQDVMIPGVTVTYNLQNAGGTQGRDQTYVLPSLPMRILSLVPKSASDIRDASGQTFASIASRRFRASLANILAWVSFAFAGVLAIFALVRAVGHFRVQERRCGSQAAGAVGARRLSRHDQRSGVRCVEDRVVAGSRASCGGRDAHRRCRRARTPGSSELRWPGRGRARWTGDRSKRVDQASARAALSVGHVKGDRQSSRQRPQNPASQRACDSNRFPTRSVYSVLRATDATASRIRRRSMPPSNRARTPSARLRTSARWPMRTAGAVMRSITIGG